MATIPPPKPCLRGVLKKEGAQGDHLVSIKGRWAMNKADFDKDVRKLTSVFEYRRESAFTGAEAVGLSHLSGRYIGFIYVKPKHGSDIKVTEHGLTISLTSLNDSKYKVQAKGDNKYGVFEMQGTATVSDADPDDLEIELFRDYTGPSLNRPKGPRGRGNKRSGSSLKGDRPGIKRSKPVAQKEPRSSSITPMPETSRGGEGGDAGHSNGHSKKHDSNAIGRGLGTPAKPRSSPAKSPGSVGTSSQNGSREPLQSVQNGSRSVPPLERPKMSGIMFRDETGAVIMKGRWWLSELNSESKAQSSGFEYKLSDQGPDRAKHLPASGLYDGYFLMKLLKGNEKVHEKGLDFHFTPSVSGSDGTYDISASGQNMYGRFTITGNARRKSNGKEVEFDIYRVYPALASVPAQKPPAARPAKLHKGDRAKDREKGAVRSAQAAQKEPRSATTPPPSSRDGEVAQRQRRVPAKLVDDPTVTGGRQRIRGLAQRFMEILRHLKSKPEAYFFLMPVDPVKLNIPSYFSIITRPMDLGTIVKRVNSYENIDALCTDIRLIFDNAVKFNYDENEPVHKAAVKLRAVFENKLQDVKAKIREDELAEERMEIEDKEQTRLKKKTTKKPGRKSSSIGGAANGSQGGSGGPADAASMQQMVQMQEKMMEMQETIKKLQRQTSSHQVQLGFEGDGEHNAEFEEAKKELLNSTPLTYEEKASLSKKIEKLPVAKLNRVIEIIQQQMELSGLQADNEIELEIDQLSTPTLRQLQAYVTECTKKPGAKAGAGGAGKAPRGGKGVKKAEGRRSPATSGKSKSKQSATKSKGGKGSKPAKSKGEPASSAKAEKGEGASTSSSSSLGSEYLALVNRAAEAHPDPVLNSHSAPLHGVKADLGNAAPQDTDASISEPAMATMASWERPNAEIDGECTSSSEDDSDDDDDAAAPLAFKKSSKPAAAATEGSAAAASGGSSSMDEKTFSKPAAQSAVPKPSPIIQTAAVPPPPEESGFIKPEPVLAAASQPPPLPSSTVAETPQPLPLPPVAVVAAREDSDDDDDGIDEQAWSSGWTAAVDPVADTGDGAQESKRPRADSDGSVSSNWKKMRSELDQRDIRERDRQIQEQEMLRAKELADQRTHEEALAEANRQIQEKEAAEQCRREEIEAQRLAEQQKILDARELERRKRNETQQTVDLNPFDVEGEFGDLTT